MTVPAPERTRDDDRVRLRSAAMWLLDPRDGETVLDAGCDDAWYGREIAARGARVVAVADAPAAAGAFDAALCAAPAADLAVVARALRWSLRPRGRIVLALPRCAERPVSAIVGPFLAAGLVVDALEEPPSDGAERRVVAARLRRTA